MRMHAIQYFSRTLSNRPLPPPPPPTELRHLKYGERIMEISTTHRSMCRSERKIGSSA